jgi:hypothetical protein
MIENAPRWTALATSTKNQTFVNELITIYGDKAHHDASVTALADSEAVYRAAAAKIVRRAVSI